MGSLIGTDCSSSTEVMRISFSQVMYQRKNRQRAEQTEQQWHQSVQKYGQRLVKYYKVQMQTTVEPGRRVKCAVETEVDHV